MLRDAFRVRKTGGSSAVRRAEDATASCIRRCFAAGTLVATAQGATAIDSLHVGTVVLAEDPKTGQVEGEPVTAVLRDPAKALMAVDLSDGSAITTTADHPVWVDAGAQLAGPGWYAAGRLRAGDELRTAAGAHVMVMGLRRNIGRAVVYTLSVAKDHTFFVGAARVLVHNCSIEGERDVDTSITAGSGEDWGGRGAEPQWGNPNSAKAYGHSASEHGPKVSSTSLADRAAQTKQEQGQWYNAQDWVQVEQAAPKHPGTYLINFHHAIGRVYKPDGTIVQDATRAVVVRTREGLIRTSYPVTDSYTL